MTELIPDIRIIHKSPANLGPDASGGWRLSSVTTGHNLSDGRLATKIPASEYFGDEHARAILEGGWA